MTGEFDVVIVGAGSAQPHDYVALEVDRVLFDGR
jgi:hypothetical protein